MIFKRLLGRKAQRAPVPENQEDLIRIVRSERDARARRDACSRITRLPELRDLTSSDLDAGVREIAFAHYSRLLCGLDNHGPNLAERIEEIATLDDQRILEQVALDGQEAELRQAAITKLASPDVLASCALNDSLAANRNAAVELLDDKRALELVAKNIGKKDKRVYRTARHKLKEIADREALRERIRAQCEAMCGKLEQLGRSGHWVRDRAVLDLLERQWAEVEPEAGQDGKARYHELRSRFLTAYEEYRSEHEAQIAAEESRASLISERRVLLEELQTLLTLDNETRVAQGLEQITARWNGLASLPAPKQAPLEREYAATRDQVAKHLEELSAIVLRNAQLHRLLDRAEQARKQNEPLDRRQIRELLENAEPLVEAKDADKALAARFASVREALDEHLRRQKKHAEERVTLLPARLNELTDAVERGSLREAERLYQSIATGIELIEASGLPRRTYDEAARRLHSLAPRVRDLQKWRKWGTDQHRRELCIAMEELVTENMRLEAMALRLHDLQMAWKGLDTSGSPADHPLWERFHAASQRVYENCKPYLQGQAAERESNRQYRERLCQELETFLEQADWERMDWKKATRAELQIRHAWSSIGPVEGRHRKALEKRYRSAMKHLSGHLAEERSRNQAQKRDLITQVEVLAAEPDLDRAVEATKSLQRQWHTSVSARQKEENRLWQRFRAACDAVFARRREQHEAQAAELTDNLHQREDLCAEAEQLAGTATETDELTAALRELDRRWRDSETLPVPRRAVANLTKRWRVARDLIDDRRRKCLEEQRREDLDLLAKQAALCERLERALETEAGTDTALAAVEADWQALPKQRATTLQAAIEKRLCRAMQAIRQGGEKLQTLRTDFVADGKRRAELCLRLEILAHVDSPPQLTEERLQFQVTRLTEHMRDGEKDPLEATSRLLQEWYLCGPAPASEAVALEERFERARRAIEEAQRGNEAAQRKTTTSEHQFGDRQKSR